MMKLFQGPFGQNRRKLFRRRIGVIGLHTKQNDVHRSNLHRVVSHPAGRDRKLAFGGIDTEAVCSHGRQVLSPRHEPNVLAPLGEFPAEKAADATCSKDDELHGVLPSEYAGQQTFRRLAVLNVVLPKGLDQCGLLHLNPVEKRRKKRDNDDGQAEPVAKRKPHPEEHQYQAAVGWVPGHPIKTRPDKWVILMNGDSRVEKRTQGEDRGPADDKSPHKKRERDAEQPRLGYPNAGGPDKAGDCGPRGEAGAADAPEENPGSLVATQGAVVASTGARNQNEFGEQPEKAYKLHDSREIHHSMSCRCVVGFHRSIIWTQAPNFKGVRILLA
jgi:hypothetical protein